MALFEALKRGGTYRTPGSNIDEVFKALSHQIQLPEGSTPEECYRLLWEREDLCSTGVGHGVAFPHPSTPGAIPMEQAQVSCHYLTSPTDFRSFDGVPVHTLFVILAPDSNTHLNLMQTLAKLMGHQAFLASLNLKPECPQLLDIIEKIPLG